LSAPECTRRIHFRIDRFRIGHSRIGCCQIGRWSGKLSLPLLLVGCLLATLPCASTSNLSDNATSFSDRGAAGMRPTSGRAISSPIPRHEEVSCSGSFSRGVFHWVASDRVAPARMAISRVASDRVASDRVASDRVASDRVASDWVSEGARGLTRSARFPWYDSTRDDVRPIHPETPRDLAGNRDSTWEKGDPSESSPQPTSRRRSETLSTFLRVVSWISLILVALAVAFGLAWALLRRDSSGAEPARRRTLSKEKASWQIEQLPFDLAPENLDLRGEAQRLLETGDFRQALIYLYGYQLAYLDQHHLIQLERGKTNRQYLSQLRSEPHLRALFEQTMVLFEDVYFGGRDVTRSQVNAGWERLDEFARHLEAQQP
jgi:hypothetical protein